jgi:hypothetical protein
MPLDGYIVYVRAHIHYDILKYLGQEVEFVRSIIILLVFSRVSDCHLGYAKIKCSSPWYYLFIELFLLIKPVLSRCSVSPSMCLFACVYVVVSLLEGSNQRCMII